MRDRVVVGITLASILVLAGTLRLTGFDLAREGGAFRPRVDCDGDVVYHAARARQLAATGAVAWFDPALNPPHGARVLWPPLLEGLAAGAAWIGAAGAPTDADVDLAATFLPVALGVLSVAAFALLARRSLGPGHGRIAALGLAAAPAALLATMIGRFDQPCLELLLFVLALLAALQAQRAATDRARRWWALGLGGAVAAAFWAWQGSALTLLLLALAAAFDHLLAPAGDPPARRLSVVVAEGALAAALLLAATILLFGPDGALLDGRIEGVSGLGVAACAGTALGAGALALAARRARSRRIRLLELTLAGAAGAGLVLALPPFRAGVLHGLLPITGANAWYETIVEFEPLLLGRRSTLADDLRFAVLYLGLHPLLAAFGGVLLSKDLRSAPDRRPALVLLGTTALALAVLALTWRRFTAYLVVPMHLLSALAAVHLARRALGGLRPAWVTGVAAVITLLAFTPAALAIRDLGTRADPTQAHVSRIAQRLAQAIRAGQAAPGVVLCSWSRGHHVRVFSGQPALTTPFGFDSGADSMTDWAKFMLARTAAEADAILYARGIRWILLEPAPLDPWLAEQLAPERAGARAFGPPISLILRLWDGNGAADLQAAGGYRLVDEDFEEGGDGSRAKLFERVPGAQVRVTGAPPGARVSATVELRTPTKRRTSLTLLADADDAGRASLRLPYAVGRNGFVRAEPWIVVAGGSTRSLALSEAEVVSGYAHDLRLGEGGAGGLAPRR
jgi:asparagine N-glycosylation enzyme membrane subunit Stt3